MTTRDTDVVRLHLGIGTRTIALVDLGLTWPPPERLYLGEGGKIREATERDEEAFILERTSMSALPDDEFKHLARGAEYQYAKGLGLD